MVLLVMKKVRVGLPSWHSEQEATCQCRGNRFYPWPGKILRALGQLSPFATTVEPECLESALCSKKATAMRNLSTETKSSPSSAQLEKAQAQQRRPSTAINKYIKKVRVDIRRYLKVSATVSTRHVTSDMIDITCCYMLHMTVRVNLKTFHNKEKNSISLILCLYDTKLIVIIILCCM